MLHSNISSAARELNGRIGFNRRVMSVFCQRAWPSIAPLKGDLAKGVEGEWHLLKARHPGKRRDPVLLKLCDWPEVLDSGLRRNDDCLALSLR